MKSSIALAVVCLVAQPAFGQVRDRAVSQAPASDEMKVLANGWSALAAGQLDAAVKAADDLLVRRPWNHAASALRIEALSRQDPMRGLDAYEKWLGPRATEDVGLLEPIARAIVANVAREGDADLRREALKILRDARIPAPAATSGDSGPADRFMADAALAAAGDGAARRRLQEAAASPGGYNKSVLVQALAAAGPTGATSLITILSLPGDGPWRGEAAAALGRLQVEEARPVLLQALNDQDPYVRSSAAVALARMGDSTAQARVDQMLQTDVPDLQLMAAEAWDGKPGPWVPALMPLLQNRDGLVRLHAAKLIAPVDPDAARGVLREAATDPNPAIRAEAGSIAESLPAGQTLPTDITALRRLLRDPDALVRLRATGAILAVARAG